MISDLGIRALDPALQPRYTTFRDNTSASWPPFLLHHFHHLCMWRPGLTVRVHCSLEWVCCLALAYFISIASSSQLEFFSPGAVQSWPTKAGLWPRQVFLHVLLHFQHFQTSQQEDKKRIHSVQGPGQRMTREGQKDKGGQEEDKKRTQGWPARPEKKKKNPDSEFRGVASQCGQLFVLQDNPNSRLFHQTVWTH